MASDTDRDIDLCKREHVDEIIERVDEIIERATRPTIAYLAVSEITPDERKGRWMVYCCYMGDGEADGRFGLGRHTYVEAYLMRKIVTERLQARGVLVELLTGHSECFHRVNILRDALHNSMPDVPSDLPLSDQIRDLAGVAPEHDPHGTLRRPTHWPTR